ncbi:unnamed protein product [Meloidogyne enterolobii]|uniref:Uncharacterized protein n=1 Tax=Meloidogyne enterolobii TaxID=390850 RepID=A0ACB0ZCW7_MELEN
MGNYCLILFLCFSKTLLKAVAHKTMTMRSKRALKGLKQRNCVCILENNRKNNYLFSFY